MTCEPQGDHATPISADRKFLTGAPDSGANGRTVYFDAPIVKINGTSLFLDEVIVGQGVAGAKNTIGLRNVLLGIDKLKTLAKNQGFTELRIRGERPWNSTTSNPGHIFDETFAL